MENLLNNINQLELNVCRAELETLIRSKRALLDQPVGNTLKYQKSLDRMPEVLACETWLDRDRIKAGRPCDISETALKALRFSLFQLCPWRKGPFDLFGIDIDSEWQSYIKWNRFIHKIKPLKNRRILDIGSSNGYYMFRTAAHDPFMVLGVEPQMTFYFQFLALQRIMALDNVFALPATFEELPGINDYFDTAFCMGILYHRKSPLAMLAKIHDMLRTGGEVVVENLILETDDHICLCPESRYAKMRNVFFIPGIRVMEFWLKRAGFTDIKCINVSKTTSEEQRKTEWIQTESLEDFLDPENGNLTVEGYPAPVRAVFTATA